MPVIYAMKIQFLENITMQKVLIRRNAKTLTEVLEYGENSILFEVSNSGCKKSHRLSLAGSLVTSIKTIPFAFTAKVVSVEVIEGKRQRLNVEFLQYDVPLWVDFLNFAKARQDQADEILKKVKGD